jgi:hypothetical protein
MKLGSYEFTLPAEDTTCAFPVQDHNNAYGGMKTCGELASIIAKPQANQKPEGRCAKHMGEIFASSEKARDQLLVELLLRSLGQEDK